jgi:hypothetical protein
MFINGLTQPNLKNVTSLPSHKPKFRSGFNVHLYNVFHPFPSNTGFLLNLKIQSLAGLTRLPVIYNNLKIQTLSKLT